MDTFFSFLSIPLIQYYYTSKELKNHYEDLLVEIEKARLPETLQKMQAEKERQDKYQNFILDKDKRLMNVKMEKYNLLSQQTEAKLKIFLNGHS